jgi:RimJ/RimL family protein N-acetyltransferase
VGGRRNFDDVELRGPRLLLRAWRPDDAGDVLAVMQDRSMHEFLALPDPYTAADARHFVTDIGHEGRRDGTGLGCAVVEQATGRLVGSAALRTGPAGEGEIGYWVAGAARGSGYAAEACGVLADWGFDIGLERIRIVCDVRNLASATTALRAGFPYEGVARGGLLSGEHAPGGPRRGPAARFAALPGDRRQPIPPSFVPLREPYPDDGVLAIRPTRPVDGDAMYEAEDDEAVRWSFSDAKPDLAAARERAERAGLEWLVGRMARFTMVDLETGRAGGFLDLRQTGPPGIGGVGYTVHPAFRGRGFTARALRLLAGWAFGQGGFARLELGAKAGNVASQRAAASGGFQPDGVRRARLRNHDGSYSDEVRFAFRARSALRTPVPSVESRPGGQVVAAAFPSRISP